MSDATKGQSARDVNDNHVHEKMDISMHDTKDTVKHRPVQLVVPEPRRMTPLNVLDDGSLKPISDQVMTATALGQCLPSPSLFQTHGLPWPYPLLPPLSGYSYPRHPGLHAYAMSMLPDHIPWRYLPVEHVDPVHVGSRIYAGLYAHAENGDDTARNMKEAEDRSSDVSKASSDHEEVAQDLSINKPGAVYLSASEVSEKKKKLKEPEQSSKYTCSACNKSYSTFSGLSKHKQFHCYQDGKKEFTCKYCDKTYVSLGALKMHIRTHTLPCKCKICGKAFSRPWLLQGHVRTHTGEKPFTCVHCLRAFADRSNLRAHLQTHSDVKKYSCKTCSRTFSRMSLLLKHEDSCARAEVI